MMSLFVLEKVHVYQQILVHVTLDTQEINVKQLNVSEKQLQMLQFVLEKEVVLESIHVHVQVDTLELNAKLHHQQIHLLQ